MQSPGEIPNDVAPRFSNWSCRDRDDAADSACRSCGSRAGGSGRVAIVCRISIHSVSLPGTHQVLHVATKWVPGDPCRDVCVGAGPEAGSVTSCHIPFIYELCVAGVWMTRGVCASRGIIARKSRRCSNRCVDLDAGAGYVATAGRVLRVRSTDWAIGDTRAALRRGVRAAGLDRCRRRRRLCDERADAHAGDCESRGAGGGVDGVSAPHAVAGRAAILSGHGAGNVSSRSRIRRGRSSRT